jgi:hypothetical protein
MIGKHNAIVVAHPDDETLFAATGRRLELGANYTWWGRK